MKPIYECKSFEGDDVIDMIDHEMEQVWRDFQDGISHEKALIKTIHRYIFNAPSLCDILKIGSAIKVDGVTLFIDEIGECGYKAIGEEFPDRS